MQVDLTVHEGEVSGSFCAVPKAGQQLGVHWINPSERPAISQSDEKSLLWVNFRVVRKKVLKYKEVARKMKGSELNRKGGGEIERVGMVQIHDGKREGGYPPSWVTTRSM